MARNDEPQSVSDASTILAVERTLVAHERTLLAWIRTAVSLSRKIIMRGCRYCRRSLSWALAVYAIISIDVGVASAQDASDQSTQSLAAAAQNPVAATYSLPLQNNTYFNAGPNHDKTANVLNIQPVLPFPLGNWNLISRTIAPLIYVPSIGAGGIGGGSLGEDTAAENVGPRGIPETFGLGDINQTFFLSPAAPSAFIWGAGPSFNLPTATEHFLGSGKFSIGPSEVGLVMPKPWVFGMLVRQLFSVAGPSGRTDVNQTLLQPFANYNFPNGWYLTTSPVITANWSVDASQRWSVPIGGGIGKIFRIGTQPINASLQTYDYVERPQGGAKLGNSLPGAVLVSSMKGLPVGRSSGCSVRQAASAVGRRVKAKRRPEPIGGGLSIGER
jgi:hypothetical protein